MEVSKDIRLDVKAAREIPTQHPQWQECSSDEESGSEEDSGDDAGGGNESEYTTDEDMSDYSDEESD